MRGSNKFSRALSISILVVLCLYAVFAMMKSENSNINKGKRYKEAIEYMNNGDFATAEDELNALAEKTIRTAAFLPNMPDSEPTMLTVKSLPNLRKSWTARTTKVLMPKKCIYIWVNNTIDSSFFRKIY